MCFISSENYHWFLLRASMLQMRMMVAGKGGGVVCLLSLVGFPPHKDH